MLAAVVSATLANKTAAADTSKLEFDPPVFYGNGLQSSLAAKSSGLVLQFNRAPLNDEIWYNVGKLGMTSMVWGANQFSGLRGHWPTVALTKDGYVLVVYNNQDRKNGCQLYYRVGKIDPLGDQNQSITWLTNSIHWDAGYKASISINDKGVIVGVHETGHNSNGMYYRVGHLRNPAGGDYTVQWDSPSWGVYYNDGVNPHIAINNLNQIVEVHEVAGEHLLHYWRGTVSGGTINLAESRRYDNHAAEPAVALLDNGVVLEVHTLGGLISRTGKLNPANAWEIQWADPIKIDPETSIGYPALAVSGSYAFETHQRPPSSTYFHEIYTSIAAIQNSGSAPYPNGTLVKGSSENAYVVLNNYRHWIPDNVTFEAMGYTWKTILRLSDNEVNTIPERAPFPSVAPLSGPLKYPTGTLVKGSSARVYVALNNYRYWIPDQATLNALGYSWDKILWLSDAEVSAMPEGTPFPSAAP